MPEIKLVVPFDITGRQVKLIWNDGGKPKIKEGTVIDLSDKFVTIESLKIEMIPIKSIVRIELKGGSGK